jgi:hypothetical protein
MHIRPFRHREVRIGTHAVAPDPQQILCPVEIKVEAFGQIVMVLVFSRG